MNMKDIYTPPGAELNTDSGSDQKIVARPIAIMIIAYLFIILALADFVYRIATGFITTTVNIDMFGGGAKKNYQFQILWLILYAVGMGLMRRGKFARVAACFMGILALIIPGLIFIYIMYFSSANEYFDKKECPKCNGLKWKNIGLLYKRQRCGSCGLEVDVKNT